MRKRATVLTGLIVVMTTASFAVIGCASLRSPVDHERNLRAEADESAAPLSLRILEGRGDRLVLQISAAGEAVEPGQTLEILRQQGDEPPLVLREVEIDERIGAALNRPDGIEFVDRELQAGATFRYAIRLFDGQGEHLLDSPVVTVTWREPPPRPSRLRAFAPTHLVSEVQWDTTRRHGAVIFRRDLLRPAARPERIAELNADMVGLFVDREIQAGGVYAYRVALARRGEGLVQYGPASEEIYVTIPPAESKKIEDSEGER